MNNDYYREKNFEYLLYLKDKITGRDLFSDEELSGACEAVESLARAAIADALETGSEVTPIGALDALGVHAIVRQSPISTAEAFLKVEPGTIFEKASRGIFRYRTEVPGHGARTTSETKGALALIISCDIVNACARAACLRARDICSMRTLHIADAAVVRNSRMSPADPSTSDNVGPATHGEYLIDVPIEGLAATSATSLRGLVTVAVYVEADGRTRPGVIVDHALSARDRNGTENPLHHGELGPGRFLLGNLRRPDPKFNALALAITGRIRTAAEEAAASYHQNIEAYDDEMRSNGWSRPAPSS